MSIVQESKPCVRCASTHVVPYGERLLCKVCGFTWHRSVSSVDEELTRRSPTWPRAEA